MHGFDVKPNLAAKDGPMDRSAGVMRHAVGYRALEYERAYITSRPHLPLRHLQHSTSFYFECVAKKKKQPYGAVDLTLVFVYASAHHGSLNMQSILRSITT